MGYSKKQMQVQLVQFANLFENGSKVKMSTRSGNFYTLKQLIDDIGPDASRFYYLSKQADQHLDFDIDGIVYKINEEFSFVDDFGFGDYRLRSPFMY